MDARTLSYPQRIVVDWPPLVDEIDAVFQVRKIKGVIFSWGDVIYLPHGGSLPPQLVRHEAVHGVRQNAFGIEAWWRKYLTDKQFRFDEELPAHVAEYQSICSTFRKSEWQRHLNFIARRLSGSLYGKLVDFQIAREMIVKAAAVRG